MVSTKILDYPQLTAPVGTEAVVVADSASTNKYVIITDLVKKWFSQVDADGNNLVNVNYQDFDRITIPADPAADHGRMYVKTVDANNDGLFMKIKQAGSIVEVQVI